jgi:hypothetical protein
VGSQTYWNNIDNDSYDQLFIELAIAVNRFLLPETLNGTATAYVYAYDNDYWGHCKPVIYSDNNNVPLARRSANEGDFDIAVSGSKPAGWRSASFQTNTSIASGNYIWFGLYCDWFAPRFDYGSKCFWDYWGNNDIPNTYPLYNANDYYDFKLSMYFTYSSAQNYVRTLTQGVRLSDNRRIIGDYKRNLTQTAGVNSLLTRYKTFFLKIQEIVKGLDSDNSSVLFVRFQREIVNNTEIPRHKAAYSRGFSDITKIEAEARGGWVLSAVISDIVHATGAAFRGLLLFVRIVTTAFVRDYILGRFLKAREELILKSVICCEINLDSRII